MPSLCHRQLYSIYCLTNNFSIPCRIFAGIGFGRLVTGSTNTWVKLPVAANTFFVPAAQRIETRQPHDHAHKTETSQDARPTRKDADLVSYRAVAQFHNRQARFNHVRVFQAFFVGAIRAHDLFQIPSLHMIAPVSFPGISLISVSRKKANEPIQSLHLPLAAPSDSARSGG